jgi:nucleolar protein 56
MATYYLFETATGYSLFEGKAIEEIGGLLESVQESIVSYKRFKKVVKLVAFLPFTLAEQALENMSQISAGTCPTDLSNFLKMNMPSVSKSKYKLAVEDNRLPNSINEIFPKLECLKNETTNEVFRGIRTHFTSMIEGFDIKHIGRAQLGLAHAYSRSKVMTDIKRYDKHIIHAISLIDQLDKDINTFAMRLKEWYSWHFPELYPIINDNILFAKAVKVIKNKAEFNEDRLEDLAEVLGSEDISKEIFQASKISMGGDLSVLDSIQISLFTDKVISLGEFRIRLAEYLKLRMDEVAPNLAALIGEIVGARLISQAGGINNLAKYPASTVQILGAEKALFRALKAGGNTPKYGILYHSSFIGRAGLPDKGKISRFLANKCSLASRIDAYFPYVTSI